MTRKRRLLLVLVAVLVAIGSVSYGLEGPAAYDATAATYFYPRRPHRDVVLLAGLACGSLLLVPVLMRRPSGHR